MDEDSLLHSKWSMALVPYLDKRRQDLQVLSRWLQVLAGVHSATSSGTYDWGMPLKQASCHRRMARPFLLSGMHSHVEVAGTTGCLRGVTPAWQRQTFWWWLHSMQTSCTGRAFAELNRLV